MIRHPSVQTHMEKLPRYYQSVNAVCKAKFENEKEKYTKDHKEFLKQEAKKLISQGIDPESAIRAVAHQHEHKLLKMLEENGLTSYPYN
jgi:hypothetical protein